MTKEEAAGVVRKEWNTQGACDTCGWHSALYEIEPIEVEDDEIAKGVAWFPCGSDDSDGSCHRGVRIHLFAERRSP